MIKKTEKTNKQYDVVVVGAGAIGCAVARELSRYDLRIAVLEKNSDVAGETTGRNSAVVHAGFNNRPGSVMASLCVEGNEGFEALCQELDVPYRRTGKLVVAFNEDDAQTLARLLSQGRANGCRDLEILEGKALAEKLREHGMVAALWSPRTGITNPFLYCVALAENAQANGVEFYLDTEVTGIRKVNEGATGEETVRAKAAGEKGMRFEVDAGGVFRCRYLINCAGLQADRIAAMAGLDSYRVWPCRGEYFILDREADGPELLPMPIYPAPPKQKGGLGVHLTPTIEGNIIIGPSAEYLDPSTRDDYACTRPVMEELMRQARQLMPTVSKRKPIGNYSGIRPKLAPPGEGGYHDFVICAEDSVPGLINLIGIESPGLTASVPIARRVCGMINDMEITSSEQTAVAAPAVRLRVNPDFCGTRSGILRFREQSPQRQAELIAEDPDYGEIICRCQKITKREIREAIENPLGARSISAIKYRAWATTGRCNGGYCLPRIVQLLVEEYGIRPEEIRYRDAGSEMFTGFVKGNGNSDG